MVGRAAAVVRGRAGCSSREGGVRWVRVHAGVMPAGDDARQMVMLHINQIAELTEEIDARRVVVV